MSDYFAAIFGAGISGTAIADALAQEGKKVLLIDPYVSENAQGAPAGLVNPATGRHAKLTWKGEECYTALKRKVDEIIQSSGRDDLISDSGVIRPAITEKLGKNFKEALTAYDWPEGWISWLDVDEVKEFNPEIAPNFGALHLQCGFTVYIDRYMNAYRQYLRENGVDCRYDRAEYNLEKEKNRFTIRFNIGTFETAKHVVVASGHHTPDFKDWAFLPLHRVKGQVVVFEAEHELEWEHAISAMGYVLRRGKRKLIVGSTYEHKFENLDTTEKACSQIEEKLAKILPGIAGKVRKSDQLAGVRVTSPNRLPVIGRHPEIENLCIYTAMGSKGLLFSQYVASVLSDHLVHQIEIPEELNTTRFNYL